MHHLHPLRIGLTGGIGSGKSTVAGQLVAQGAALVDTDAIAKALTAPGGAAMPAIGEAFGAQMVDSDGALDRDRMRALAFADPLARKRLEAIIHPLIGDQARQAADAAERSGAPAVVFDVPLLTESAHWRARVDRVLVVDCTRDTQIQRVMARSGWAKETVLRVIQQQAARERRRAIADAIIFNETLTLAALEKEVRGLWQHWLSH